MITGERPYPSLLGVTAHEMSHAWHQHVLATNEAKHPWMDEGFTEYATSHAVNYVNGVSPKFPNESSYERYYALANSGVEQPQTVHSDRYDFNFAYGASSYSKGSVFMAQLGYIIGEESLKKTIKRYYEDFKLSTIVMKFGGTSVADLNIMRNAILKIVEEVKNKKKVIVVVSAMGSTTDHLVRKVKEVSAI